MQILINQSIMKVNKTDRRFNLKTIDQLKIPIRKQHLNSIKVGRDKVYPESM